MDNGVVNIKGKNYKLVSARVEEFRSEHPDAAITTNLVHHDLERTIVQCIIRRAGIDGYLYDWGSGIAEEFRSDNPREVNSTSAIENAETSAIGRALASIGYAGGDSYGSADEVARAISQQDMKEVVAGQADHMQALRENWSSVHAIRESIADYHKLEPGDLQDAALAEAAACWFELDEETKRRLWRAPTKGGVFTTEEREFIKSSQFRKAFYGEE